MGIGTGAAVSRVQSLTEPEPGLAARDCQTRSEASGDRSDLVPGFAHASAAVGATASQETDARLVGLPCRRPCLGNKAP